MAWSAERFKALRNQAGLTQEQLAEKSGLTARYICMLERKTDMPYPKISTCEKLATALDVPFNKFLSSVRAPPQRQSQR